MADERYGLMVDNFTASAHNGWAKSKKENSKMPMIDLKMDEMNAVIKLICDVRISDDRFDPAETVSLYRALNEIRAAKNVAQSAPGGSRQS